MMKNYMYAVKAMECENVHYFEQFHNFKLRLEIVDAIKLL